MLLSHLINVRRMYIFAGEPTGAKHHHREYRLTERE